MGNGQLDEWLRDCLGGRQPGSRERGFGGDESEKCGLARDWGSHERWRNWQRLQNGKACNYEVSEVWASGGEVKNGERRSEGGSESRKPKQSSFSHV